MQSTASPFRDHVVHWTSKNNIPLRIRHIHASDTPLMVDLFYRLSARTLSLRFATAVINVPLKKVIQEACRLATIDHETQAALVALMSAEDGSDQIVAVARLAGMTEETAEFALTVRDDFQGQGVGAYLLDLLTQVALAKGLKTLTASVLAENAPMIKLIRRLGFPIHIDTSHGESDVIIYLDPTAQPTS